MKGHVKKRGDRYYAVIYEGRDPVTGKERRSWHPAGTDRAEAERLAATLAATETSRIDAVRSLTFGAYLTSQWLPTKKLHLATSTYRGYERNVVTPHPAHVGQGRNPAATPSADRGALRHAAPPRRGQGARAQDRLCGPSDHQRRAR